MAIGDQQDILVDHGQHTALQLLLRQRAFPRDETEDLTGAVARPGYRLAHSICCVARHGHPGGAPDASSLAPFPDSSRYSSSASAMPARRWRRLSTANWAVKVFHSAGSMNACRLSGMHGQRAGAQVDSRTSPTYRGHSQNNKKRRAVTRAAPELVRSNYAQASHQAARYGAALLFPIRKCTRHPVSGYVDA